MNQLDSFPVIIGIETSCDETAVGILRGDREILSNVVVSQVLEHTKYGGVVPEIASRQHARTIDVVFQKAVEDAQIDLEDVSAVAVTEGPGLVGALLVGISFAKALAYALDKPLIGVNHLLAHIYANFLVFEDLIPPFLVLLVSGGHTELLEFRSADEVIVLGRTRDDAAGEAFDKVARLLGLGYPGGPVIEEAAKRGRAVHPFPRSLSDESTFDFSFSGLKTSVLYFLREHPEAKVEDVAASFQEAVVDTLISKLELAIRKRGLRRIVLAGGVAANQTLRKRVNKLSSRYGLQIYFPPVPLCTDNGVMVARAGVEKYRKKEFSNLNLSASPALLLS